MRSSLAPLAALTWALGCTAPNGSTPTPAFAPAVVAETTTQDAVVNSALQPIPSPSRLTPCQVSLGRRLFQDARLSTNGLACASCHPLDGPGTKRIPVSNSASRTDVPTVFNAALNPRQFWDGRARSLEEQVDGPLLNPDEMRSSWQHVESLLSADRDYRAAFASCFPDGVRAANVRKAIATFERTLLTPGSDFDRFLRGDHDAISASAREGYLLFQNYGCSTCHEGANVGGNVFERLGVIRDFESVRPGRVLDDGRKSVTHRDEDEGVFRVPSLRLATRTAPYFHDGSVATLDDAIGQMGELQLGIEIGALERAKISAFLESLVGQFEGRNL
jgi:cytochrome c peroxidase